MKNFPNKNIHNNVHSHKNSISNIIKTGKNKVHFFNKIKPTNKHQNILNTIKINDKTRKILNIPKINAKNINLSYDKKSKEIDSKNNISINHKDISHKNLSKKENAQFSDNISIYNDYQTSTINPKKMLSKNNNKNSLIRSNNEQNQKNVNKNNQKLHISINFLFKNKKVYSKEVLTTFKDSKNNKKFLKKNCSNELSNCNTIESKIYNSNNNILNLNKKTILKNKSNNKNKNKNNTSTQLQNIFNTNNSIIKPSYQKATKMSHKNNLNNNETTKTININNSLIKKFNDLGHPEKIALGDNENKNLEKSINNINICKNFFQDNINSLVSNNTNKNLGKKTKKQKVLKQKDILDNNENDDEDTLKRLKTEKMFELYELDKSIYQLIIKKKKKNLDQEISISISSKKLTQVNQNLRNSLIKNSDINKKMDNSQKHLGINNYKLSPIKPEYNKYIKKYKNNLKKSNKRKKIDNYLIKNEIYIQNSDTKKEKKNLCKQIETKYLYQKNSKQKDLHKNKNLIKDKIYSTIDSILTNCRNHSNTLRIKKFESINNSISRNHEGSMNCNNYSNYFRKTDFEKKKRKICNIDFDILEKEKNKENKETNINVDFKNKNMKNYEFIKTNVIQNNKKDNINNKNKKNQIIKGSCKNEEKKLKENIKPIKTNKEIKSINDFYYEEELEEDYLIRDTSQSTNNITKIKSKKKNHIKNVLKHKTNLIKKQNKQLSSSLYLSLYKEENILYHIINFCNYNTLNKLCLLSKNYYKYIKPLIHKKIKANIININKNNSGFNIIKKSVLQYTPLSSLSSVMLLKKYKDLLYELNEKYDIEIKKDLLRTDPDNASFQYGKENYNKLYHILSAYSNYNKNIGYAQGLNFLASLCIYIYKNEIDAFIFLDGLVRKFNLENLYGINNNILNDKLIEIEKIVNKWCPEVNKHLQRIILNYDFFIIKWMISLFANQMNIKYLLQLWDYLIILGWKFFKGFVISVIKFNEKMILNSSLETITKNMNNIFKTKEFENNFYEIIDYTFYFIKEESEIL